MDVENIYYKKIIYKKNAFLDMQTYVKLNFNNKKILLFTSKSIPSEETSRVMNALMAASESVCCYVSKNNFDKIELDKLHNKINSEKYDLFVALGAGRCCEVCKFFAFKNNVPYIACPTLATSMSFFTNYCLNPYDMSDGFYANMPIKIFIQESLIRGASFYSNVMGLCFLNSIRAVYVEGVCSGDNEKNIIFKDMEKLFKKLEYEQTNILLCDEDANLTLMDLFIDFGFLMAKLDKNDYFLFNFYKIYGHYSQSVEMAGVLMLLCSKMILSLYKKYLEVDTVRCFEIPKVELIKNIAKKDKFYGQIVKNVYFCEDFIVKNKINERMGVFCDIVQDQYKKIRNFCNSVKNVYKLGLEVSGDYGELTKAMLLALYMGGDNYLTKLIAGSGVLNNLLSNN